MSLALQALLVTVLAGVLFILMGYLPPLPSGITDMVTTAFQYLHVFDLIFPMDTLITVLTWAFWVEVALLSIRILALIKKYTQN